MTKITFSPSDFRRKVADAESLILRNRYFEKNPFLSEAQSSLLARPGMKRWLEVGDGPIRGIFSTPGAFDGDLFAASYDKVFRVGADKTITEVQDGLFNPDTGFVNMAIAARIAPEDPDLLFFCDGRNLFVYDGTTSTAISTPDDVGVIDVAVSSSYVIVIPAQGEDINGRFYWINPGETTINPLNFATAESAPDGIYGVKTVGDQFWLPGESTVEVWYATGDNSAPMSRMKGMVFDRGTWENTAVALDQSMVVTDADGAVYLITGGSPQRISTPDIEETIRRAIQRQQKLLYEEL